MSEQNIDLEEFITWFSKQEDIPLQTRIDMLAYLEKTGHLDDKSADFIETYMHNRDEYEQQRIAQLVDELTANQHKPDPQNIIDKLKDSLNGFVENFKTGFKVAEAKLSNQSEKNEQQTELDQVAALKANLGV